MECHREASSHTSWGGCAFRLPEPLACATTSSISLLCQITESEGGNRLVEKLLFAEERTSSRTEHLEKLCMNQQANVRLEQGKRDKTCQFVIHAIILSNVKFTELVSFGFVFGREQGRGIFYFVLHLQFSRLEKNPIIYDHFSFLDCHMAISGSSVSTTPMCST